MSPSPPSTPRSPRNPKHGIFQNERWLCNCDPRLDAVVKTVSRNTKNYGRRFYTCPKYGQGNHCDMFLFVEDAKPREWECLMSNGRSEKRRQTTILEAMSPSKGKRRSEDATALTEVADSQAISSEASTSKSAAASASNMASQPRSHNNPSSAAPSSTLKASSGAASSSRTEDFYDTTSDEDEDEEETNNRASHTTTTITINNNNLLPSAIAATPTTTQPTGSKRKRSFEDDDLLDDLSSGGEEELVAATERSSRAASTRGKQREPFITPSTVRTADMLPNGLPTPSQTKEKSVKKVLFKDEIAAAGESSSNYNGAPATTTAKRQRLDDGGTAATATSHAARLFGTDATIGSSSSPSPPPPGPNNANLTAEIMSLLKDEDITPSVRDAVRKTLDKYVNQAKGYERGRDASRRAVKEAEDRTAAMKQRVDDLERSRQELRSQLMDMWGRV